MSASATSPLTSEQKKRYRRFGHHLKPVVVIAAKGLNASVKEELTRALDDHELIKVKLAIIDRDIRKAVIQEMCQQLQAELIQEIGKIALIHRRAKKPKPKLSNLRR